LLIWVVIVDNENPEYNIDPDDLPPGVSEEDEELFNKAQLVCIINLS